MPTSRASAISSSASSRCAAQEADAVGYEGGERYDALLDQYEPDMRVARLEPLLTGLRDELVPFVREIAARPRPDDAFVRRTYPAREQRAVGARLAAAIGFDFEAGRLDEAAHPFASGFAPGDVRLTTREHEDDLFSGLFAVLHEAGHGLYEQGLTGAIEGTFCGNATSLGLHESQSRFWENMVGRSRAFWERHLGEVKAAFPAQLGDVSLDQFVRAANLVEPSLIRVEADEVTYHLHVFLRFELELALMRGDLSVDDLPATWNERMRTLVGIEPPNDGVGVLQDVHWSAGLIGYFPTYTLGTLYSAQFLAAIEREMGPVDVIIRAGEYDRLLGWMRAARAQPRRAGGARADRARRDRRGAGPCGAHALPARQVRRALRPLASPRAASGAGSSCTARPSRSSRSRCARASASAKRCSWKPSRPPNTCCATS